MNFFKNLFIKDTNASLGSIRISFGILGGLIIAYMIIMIIAKFLNESIFENIVIGIIILPIFWSTISLWIVLSQKKITAILKSIIPSILLYIIILLIG